LVGASVNDVSINSDFKTKENKGRTQAFGVVAFAEWSREQDVAVQSTGLSVRHTPGQSEYRSTSEPNTETPTVHYAIWQRGHFFDACGSCPDSPATTATNACPRIYARTGPRHGYLPCHTLHSPPTSNASAQRPPRVDRRCVASTSRVSVVQPWIDDTRQHAPVLHVTLSARFSSD
jgi:hypothetical protein